MTKDECSTPPSLYKKEEITDRMMCANGTLYAGDICDGDDGSPLMVSHGPNNY